MKKAKAQPKYIYLGFIPEQKVARVPLWDSPEITKRYKQGWVTTTKDAWERFQAGSKIIFHPVVVKGIMMMSQVVYPPKVIKIMSLQRHIKAQSIQK